jgi:CDP-glycerol glycerophosphotransferase
MDDAYDPNAAARIAGLEQKLEEMAARLALLEQGTGVVAKAEQTALQALRQLQEGFANFEHQTLARRICNGLEAASRIYPKTRSVVFVGRDYFGDNIKYAFLSFCRAQANDISCTFLTDDERQYRQLTDARLPCLPWQLTDWTAQHMRILLSARVAVLCNILYPSDERKHLHYALLRGAQHVQLWHGIPFKEVGLECLYTPATFGPKTAEILAASGPFETFVGTGKALEGDWAKRFAFRDYAPIGSPRTDVLFRTARPDDLINVDEDAHRALENAAKEGTPTILYAPTFRDQKLGVWLESSGIERFAAVCAQRGWLLYVNIHPFEQPWLAGLRERYPAIRFVASPSDIYPLLKNAAVLVTDYSSLVFDYLLLDRPVVFFRPDHAAYTGQSRTLIAAHQDYICGDVAADAEGLAAAAEAALKSRAKGAVDPHRAARAALRRRIYDNVDGDAGKRLIALIRKIIDKG